MISNYQQPKEKKNISIIIFVLTTLIIGFFYGIIIANQLKKQNILFIINDISSIVNNLEVENSFSLLIKCFFTHFIYIFAIWFLSLTIIGIIIVIFIIFFIGFIYGFVFSSFVCQFGIKGILIAFFYTFPQNIIILPLLVYISSKSIIVSINLFKSFYYNSYKRQTKMLINEYYNLLFFSIGVIIIYSLLMCIFGKSFVNILKSIL